MLFWLKYSSSKIVFDTDILNKKTLKTTFMITTKDVSFMGILWIHIMITSQLGLIAQLVRALYRYSEGYGFESGSSLNFFRALFSQLFKLCI